MAVAYATIANSAWASTTSTVVTKPTGLAVGDIMVAYCAGNADAFAYPSGFTSIGSTSAGVNNYQTRLGYKVADSSDVAASNFTFTIGTSVTNLCALIRVTGASIGPTTIISSGALTSDTATPSIAGITPAARGDNLLLQLWHGSDAVASIASYAIVTTNPTWTEILDSSTGATTGVGIAWATRTVATATGNFSCAGGNGTTDWGGWLVSFAPAWSTATAETITVTDTEKLNMSILIREVIALTDSIVATMARVWVNAAKNVSTWINQNKQ